MKSLQYDSGCELTERPPTPGKWQGTVFTAMDGTKWTFDPSGPDPREDDTGTHALLPFQVAAIFETKGIEAPAPLSFKHGFDDPVCECELAKVRNPYASECMTCKRMVPMHDRFWKRCHYHPPQRAVALLPETPHQLQRMN